MTAMTAMLWLLLTLFGLAGSTGLLLFGAVVWGFSPAESRGEMMASPARVNPTVTPLPAETYARPEWLADAAWLRHHLTDATVKVVALTPATEFAAGHVPGAAQIDWPALEVTDTADHSIARWRREVEAKLTALGLAPSDTVVAYDGGTFYAPRLWWILHHLGHSDVRVLNGGLPAWTAAGGELETGPSRVAPAPVPYRGSPDPMLLAQLSEVEAALGDPAVALVDARSAEEYAAGHIPGAVSVEFTANGEATGPKYLKPAAELRAIYRALGVTPDKRVIAYCTTGVRASAAYFALGLLGYDGVAVYPGSWKEWSGRPQLPVAIGVAP